MKKTDAFEKDIIEAYESGLLQSRMPSTSDMKAFRAAARATSIKDRRINIRLSSSDLRDLRARALEDGVPYQTLIASVLHKFVAGRFIESSPRRPRRSTQMTRRKSAS